ncbi:MAG: hypothetical protein Q4A84_08005 [Neisseria sp.]|uniref:hypothetical protein n=1 Tax=Neisseria sp. TaxID=192066 RepID=UPI0026DBF143|nr:hypothetical protein [Neisseria sp.]MDO4641624.1 hypothetical protein [Neisseria sp.]
MKHQIYLKAASCFNVGGRTDRDLKRYLKTHYHIDARRLSRLTMLSLAGSLLLARYQPDEKTPVYVGSKFSSPTLFNAMMDNVFEQQLAKPLDFLSNLHNAPAFHVAAALGLAGPTVFQTIGKETEAWSKPLLVAANHVGQNGGSALVGWCNEAEPPGLEGGSCWLLLCNEQSQHDLPVLEVNKDMVGQNNANTFQTKTDGGLEGICSLVRQLNNGNCTVALPLGGGLSIDIRCNTGLTVWNDDLSHVE